MAKNDYIRTPNSGSRMVDFNLAIAQYLKIPVFTGDPSLYDNPDEAGAIAIDKFGHFVVYDGSTWARPGIDMTAVNDAIALAVANLVDSAPDALDTLGKIAAALGNDSDFSVTVNALIATKVDKVTGKQLSTEDYTTTEKAKLATLTERFKGKYATLLALQTAVPVGNDGDYAIVTGTPNDQESIWDSDHSAWVLTENIPATTFASIGGAPADNAALNSVLTGMVTAQVSGDAALQTQVSALSAALIPHPTYTTPTAVLSSTQSTSWLEVGQTVNIPLTVVFNQNDGGAQGAMSVKKDGTQIATASPYTDSAVVMALTAKVYQSNVAYAQGPIKNNIIGVPDATGRIAGGNVNSNSLSYQGFYKIWYDAVAAFPTNSATARALTNSRLSNAGNTFTLNTGAVQTKFCLILPPGKTLTSVVDQDALNLDITAQYVSGSITVNDAAGNPVTCTIYSMSQSIPYSASHRHNITIA